MKWKSLNHCATWLIFYFFRLQHVVVVVGFLFNIIIQPCTRHITYGRMQHAGGSTAGRLMICPSPKLHIGRYRDIYTRSKMGSRCYCCYVAFHFLFVHYLFLLSAVSYTYTALPCWSFQTCGFYILRAVLILFLKCFSLYIQKKHICILYM